MLLVVAFALLVLWLRYLGLPNVDRYRERIVASIDRATGMNVTVRAIHGGWDGLRPSLAFDGFEISDRRGTSAFAFERAEATLSWWALFRGRVHFHDVDFHRPNLVLRRARDGLIYLADKPLNAAAPAGEDAFTEWLLTQPRLGIHDATLVWRDEMTGVPEVRFTDVQIVMRRQHGRHHAALSARPPPELGGRIDVRADVKVRAMPTRWTASGEVFAEALDTDLGELRARLPLAESLRSGFGSARVWATFDDATVSEVVADVSLRDARAQLAADALPLELASISGRASYVAKPGGFTLATEGLRFRLPNGLEVHPGKFSLTRTGPQTAVRADGIDLKIAASLIDAFPVPRDIKAHVQRFAPRGRIADASLTWRGEGAAQAYALKGRFEDFAMNAVDAWPGVAGLSGSIEGSEAGGTVVLASKNASLDVPRIYATPVAFETLDARASWKMTGRELEVAVQEARFANADAAGEVSGTWHALPDSKEKSPGYADFKGTLSRAIAARAASYLPKAMSSTRAWLERSVLAGTSSHVEFALKGDLWRFPFGDGDAGHFLVAGNIVDGRLKYHPDWPSVDAVQGSFRFENRGMEIRASAASIFASRASTVVATIDDFAARPPRLILDGVIDTTGADSVRFLRESPLVNGPGAFTRAIAIEGPARLKLHLDYPLWGREPVHVAGDYQFAGAAVSVVGRDLKLEDVRGGLSFTELGVRAPAITGTLFGNPARLTLASQPDDRVLTTLDGRIDARSMDAFVPEPVAQRFSGAAQWNARIVSGKQGTDLTIASDLDGLAMALPAPFGKPAALARPLTLAISRLGADDEVTTATFAGNIHGRFARAAVAGTPHWQAALRFGAPLAEEPVRDGLWLYGALAALDVDAWQALFAAPAPISPAAPDAAGPVAEVPGGDSVELRGVDLKLAHARYLGRDFTDLHAVLERSGARWNGTLDSPRVAGEVHWDPEGKGHLTAKLARLALDEGAHDEAPVQGTARDLPALDVSAERFEFRGHALGALALKAQPAGEAWRIERLDIVNGHARFNSTGEWRRTGAGSITVLDLKLVATNLNSLLAQFGYGDYLKRGDGSLEGQLVWPGYPYDFALSALSGTLHVQAHRGQFAKIEPGAGKLLGLLSLQSLPRRALFDFRDVFSDGFAFERIQGNVKVARGVLLTDDFEISGPSAFVSLAGEVSLPAETQSLTLRVVPEVSEGIALAASVIGTPVLGLSTLLVSKLLRNPLGKVVAYEYQVTGTWDNPQVARTSAPPPKASAAATP